MSADVAALLSVPLWIVKSLAPVMIRLPVVIVAVLLFKFQVLLPAAVSMVSEFSNGVGSLLVIVPMVLVR